MKKIAILSAISSFLAASVALAQNIVVSPPTKPTGGAIGYSDLGAFVSNVLILAFGVALLIVLAMLVWGAFEWITSGGDKDSVAKARNRIISALVGLAVLAVAYALANVAGRFLGFELTQIPVPTPR